MFKKILVALSLSAFLTSLSFAEDLLAYYTDGKLTENSPGVKVLSLDEKKQVKGGYIGVPLYGKQWGNNNEYYIMAFYSSEEFVNGLCPLGQTSCNNHSVTKLNAFNEIVNQKRGEYGFFPVYIVKREIQYSRYGQAFVVFKYSTGAMDANLQLYKFNSTTSGLHLNNNIVIKELANHYKTQMESALGGWYVR